MKTLVLCGSLLLTGCALFPGQGSPDLVWKPELTPRQVAERVARRYGVEAFDAVNRIGFQFHADIGEKRVRRAWVWEPPLDRVTLQRSMPDGSDYVYLRRDAAVNAKVDATFVNDTYWLLFPFRLVWDDVSLELGDAPEALPVGEGMGRRLTVRYPEQGGYTPGDAYDLYLDKDATILAWVFRQGNAATPTRTAAWNRLEQRGPLWVNTRFTGPSGSGFEIRMEQVYVQF